MDAAQVKEALAARAEDVCRMLIPAGRRDRGEWVCGDIHGAEGQSLRIHLEGPKAGWWADFAQADQFRGKNLLSLWMAVRNLEFGAALEEAKSFLGVRDGWVRETGRKEVRPAASKLERPLESEYVPLSRGGPVWKWLTEERKLGPDVLEAYRIGESRDGKYVVFPSFDAAGKLASLKFRAIEDKKQMFTLPKGGPKLLFGIQAIDANQQELAITEGELDAMSLAQYGFPAVSVPFGAKWPGADGSDPNSPWIEHDFEWLSRFVEIWLALDADDPGQKAAAAIAPRMGLERVRLVAWPAEHKDANGCLMAGVVEKDVFALLAAAKGMDPAELKKPGDFKREIWVEFFPEQGGKPLGRSTPWKVPFQFNFGELTVWHGYNGSGKTVCLNNVILGFAAQGDRSCVASLEFPSPKTFRNICRAAMGKAKPSGDVEFDRAIEWMDQWFWIYNHIGPARVDDVLEVFIYTARKYGVKHFVLDSLMMLSGIAGDDYDQQKDLCLKLKDFAERYGVHVHLVAHSKKPDAKHPAEKHWPGKFDISGSGSISNVADNVVCVWRNKGKEMALYTAQDLAKAGKMDEADKLYSENSKREDALFIVQKNRETGLELACRLWFDKGEAGSWRYLDEDQWDFGATFQCVEAYVK
jgi:twinkle protein